MADPASKKDFQEVISNLKTFQDEAAEKRRKEDQIKYNEDQKRLMEIGKELKEANATDTLKLEAEKNKITQERSIEKLKQESGKRAVEIQKSGMELQKKAIEATGGVASDNKEYREEERKIKLAELAERKRNATSPAAKKEIAKEERELLGNYFERFLGKDSRLASGLTSIGEGLKAKVKGGLEGIFAAIKAGAFALFLLGVVKFLRSDTFKKLKDKWLPLLADGLEKIIESFKKLGEAFGNISETIDNIVAGFTDEDGNITFVAGVKNAIKELSDLFEGTGAALATIGGLTLFAFRKQLIRLALGVGSKLLSISGLTSIFSNNLDTVDSDMKKRNKASRGKRGIFGLGLRGIGSRFGKLFLRLGAFGALIGGASLLMSDKVDASGKTGGVFDKVKTGFNSLFSVVGDFAKSIGRVATAAASATADAIKSALKSVAKIGAKKPPKPVKLTRSQLDAISGRGDFKIKPSAISTPRVDNTPKPNPIKAQTRVTELAPTKTFPRFSNPPKIGIEPPAPKISVAPRLPTLDTVIPKVPMINLKSSAKIKPTVKKLTKASMAASLLKYGGLGAIKMLPGIGIAAGLIFSASRLLAGDKVGAAMELGGTFAPSVTGLPIDAAIMARDIYEDQFGVYPEQEQDSELRKERMRTIAKFLSDKLRKKKALVGASPPALTAEKRAELIQKRSVFNYASTDLPSFAEYEKSAPLLRVNPSFDRNSDGVYNEKEFRRASAATRRSRGNESVLDSQGGAMFLSQTINAPSQQQVFKIDKTIVGDAYADKIANR